MDEPGFYVVALLVYAIVFGGLGLFVANAKNRPSGEGFCLGLLFGPLGALIEALLPNGKPPAPPQYFQPVARPSASPPRPIPPPKAEPFITPDAAKEAIDRFDARLAAAWAFVVRAVKGLFGGVAYSLSLAWVAELPEWAQPVVWGLGIAALIGGIALAFLAVWK
jgi:MFS family permease